MIGRQTIKTNRAFTLGELEQFMQEAWDKSRYNDFSIGRPTPASIEEYILLPATYRFMVIVYARKNKVILAVCDTKEGVKQDLARSIPSDNVLFGIWKVDRVMSMEKERKGPAEEALQAYAAYMRELLRSAGYLD